MFSAGRSTAQYDRVSDFDVLSYYFGIKKIPAKIHSPLRDDKKPSFGLYTIDGETVRYIDFATGEKGNLVKLMSLYWNISYNDAYKRIVSELGTKQLPTPIMRISKLRSTMSGEKHIDIGVKVRPWEKYDIDFWESYGISLPWLEFGDVYPISHVILHHEEGKMTFGAEKYAYAYVEHKDGITSVKIYQPFSTTRKWMNNHDSSVWDLWSKIPEKGDKLIITSSRKDALCIWENTGIPSLSLQAEGYIPKRHVVEQLKERFSHVFVLYDNDFQSEENHGVIFGKRISSEFGITMLLIPEEYQTKDPSDFCRKYGRKETNKLINKLIQDGLR